MSGKLSLTTIGIVMLIATTTATAAPVIYTSLSAFEAAAAGIGTTTDDLDDLSDGNTTGPIVRSGYTVNSDGVTIWTLGPTIPQFGDNTTGGALSWAQKDRYLWFVFDTPVNAFAIDIGDFGDAPTASRLYISLDPTTHIINDDLTKILALGPVTNGPNGERQFVGVIDTENAFSAVGIGTLVENIYDDAINLDNVRYGVIPEPGTLALMSLALVGLGATRIRRK